ncbi:MAG TPA: general secretion pathway protein GspB [Gallionella sp.]
MSYILDALKKSDQQRRRGAAPTLHAVQVTVAAPQRPLHVYYGLLAAALLAAGIAIGWLRPWQAGHAPEKIMTGAPEPVVVEVSTGRQQQVAPLHAPSVRHGMPAGPAQRIPVKETPARDSTAARAVTAGQPPVSNPLLPDGGAQVEQTLSMDQLPFAIRQEIPAMEVQLHAYSGVPSERLVSINSIRLREGGALMAGLRLEQITPDGMIFSYKGYRFRRGIR